MSYYNTQHHWLIAKIFCSVEVLLKSISSWFQLYWTIEQVKLICVGKIKQWLNIRGKGLRIIKEAVWGKSLV